LSQIYKSNNQLGGCPVMSPNGVTHWEVADDHAGCDTIVRWLDLIPDQAPARLGDIPPFEVHTSQGEWGDAPIQKIVSALCFYTTKCPPKKITAASNLLF